MENGIELSRLQIYCWLDDNGTFSKLWKSFKYSRIFSILYAFVLILWYKLSPRWVDENSFRLMLISSFNSTVPVCMKPHSLRQCLPMLISKKVVAFCTASNFLRPFRVFLYRGQHSRKLQQPFSHVAYRTILQNYEKDIYSPESENWAQRCEKGFP